MNYYVLLACLGFLAASVVFLVLVKKEGYSLKLASFLAVASLTGLFAGGRLFGIIAANIYKAQNGISVVPGFVFYGGLIGFLTVFILLQKVSMRAVSSTLCDIIAVSIPLFHAFGRVGCFISGCCGGVIPVQLIEASFNLCLFIVLLFSRNKLKGILLPLYLISYSIFRFVIEFFRTDDVRGIIGFFSFGQLCSVAIFIGTIIFLFYTKRKSAD